MKKSLRSIASTLAGLTLATTATSVQAATVTVSPLDMGSWSSAVGSGDGVVEFVGGPGTAPLGLGSARLFTGSAGDGLVELCDASAAGVRLDELTELGFSTWATSSSADGKLVPSLALDVDHDGNGAADDTIHFEPAWQNPVDGNAALPDQGAVALGTWQSWDALAGGWWSESALDGSSRGSGVKALADYLAVAPEATIVFGVCLGLGGGLASDVLDGNVDAFTMGVSGAEATTSDFEPADSDGDGVIDEDDACPASDLSQSTVVLGTCDSGVANTFFPNGCSVLDLAGQCLANAKNHGKFVSCVSKMTNGLKKSGVITGNQKGKIQSCAARMKKSSPKPKKK